MGTDELETTHYCVIPLTNAPMRATEQRLQVITIIFTYGSIFIKCGKIQLVKYWIRILPIPSEITGNGILDTVYLNDRTELKHPSIIPLDGISTRSSSLHTG